MDFSRPFFDQFKELSRSVPHIAIFNTNSENSEFTAHSSRNKNCYLCVSALSNEECYYGFQITECTDVCDAAFARGSSKSYELVDCEQMYNSVWCQKSSNCTDAQFLYDCHGCNNCCLSVNLKNKEYCFMNEQLSQEAYKKKINTLRLSSFESVEKIKKEFADYVRAKAQHRFAAQTKCEDSTGDYLFNCMRAKQCFDARNLEDCKYIIVSPGPTKDSYDVNYAVFGAELFCEVLSTVDPCMSQQFCEYSWASSYLQYCSYVMNSENCFGCAGMRKAKFCILNKQYSESEYYQLRGAIIEHMKKTDEYGQFFPASLSPFGYNETVANDEWPLTKEIAPGKGFHWSDEVAGRYDAPSRDWSGVADDISQAEESLCREVFSCIECKKNFRILKQEFEWYKKMNVPLPRRCFDCRHRARMHMRNPRKLWERHCMCGHAGHGHGERCDVFFETSYSPDRPEKIFCEQCYQRETE